MVDTIVGGALALVLLGLPLAIIGLFVQSVLARRSALRAELHECPARLLSPHRPQRRRRVLASPPLYPLLRLTAADHAEPAAPLGPRPHAETTHVSTKRPDAAERPRTTPDPHVTVAAASVQRTYRMPTPAPDCGA
jgi:hypothetical protein